MSERDLQAVFDSVSALLRRVPGVEAFAGPMAAAADRLPAPSGDTAALAFARGIDWAAQATAATLPVVRAFSKLQLDWIRPYEGDPRAGPDFVKRSAFCMLSGPAAPDAAANFMAGFFVVGPNVQYHDHRHGPAELYLPLSGRARYWSDAGGWLSAEPGRAIVHPPWAWHAMTTQDEAVLIFWAWLNEERAFVPPELRETLAGL